MLIFKEYTKLLQIVFIRSFQRSAATFIKKTKLYFTLLYSLFTIHKCFQCLSSRYDVLTVQLWRVSVASPCALVDGSWRWRLRCLLLWRHGANVLHDVTLGHEIRPKDTLTLFICSMRRDGILAALSNTFPEFFGNTVNVYNVPKWLLSSPVCCDFQIGWNRLTVLCPLQHSSTYFCPYRIEHELPSQA